MKTLLWAGVTALVAALAVGYALLEGQLPPDVVHTHKPAWIADTEQAVLMPELVEVRAPERESESGLSDMEPPSESHRQTWSAPWGSRAESGREVKFEARLTLDADVAIDIAHTMIAAAEASWKLYQDLKLPEIQQALPNPDLVRQQLQLGEYTFAIWPDLGELIRSKQVQMDVRPVPDCRTAPHVFYTLDHDRKELGIQFRGPRWVVTITVDESVGPADLMSVLFRTKPK